MRRIRHALLLLALALLAAGAAAQPAGKAEGVEVGKSSELRRLVPADRLEQAAAQQYTALLRQAAAKSALAPDDHPQLVRLRAIGKRVIAQAARFNPQAAKWRWEINLIGSNQINAFCMPGGKIAFFTGILARLKLTDDEVAAIMGHEVAHALLEHARERVAKSELTRLGVLVDHQDGLTRRLQCGEAAPDLLADERREALGRFVQDQQARVGRQRAADREHLLLAAGELATHVVGANRERREDGEQALDAPRL